MIKVLIGDMFDSRAATLVNTVNCVGVMGKGVAAEFKKRFPQMFEDYAARCAAKQVKPGEPYLYTDMLGTSVINFPTKDHWRSPSRLADVEHGLDRLVAQAGVWELRSLAVPPLGCGNGGLDWEQVGPVMYAKLSQLDIPVEIYAPYGTPQSQLTASFLGQSSNFDGTHGRTQQKLNPQWLALIEVVFLLQRQPYANPVGRTIFQKIAYLLTEQGVATGFTFRQGSYGPFSAELNDAFKVFANSNLIEEQTLGRMVAVRAGPAYEGLRTRYADVLEAHQSRISRTVDLFSRIKSTAQAEEVSTVLYAARKLKQEKTRQVSEAELLEFITEWKGHWNTHEKRSALLDAIRNLEMLNWVRLTYSEALEAEC